MKKRDEKKSYLFILLYLVVLRNGFRKKKFTENTSEEGLSCVGGKDATCVRVCRQDTHYTNT